MAEDSLTAQVARSLASKEEGDLAVSITVTPPGATTPAYAWGGGRRTAGSKRTIVAAGILYEDIDVRHHAVQRRNVDHRRAAIVLINSFSSIASQPR